MGPWVSRDRCIAERMGGLMHAWQIVPDIGFSMVLALEVEPLLKELGYPQVAKTLRSAFREL